MIFDEVYECGINIDVFFGLMKKIVEKWFDLKLIVILVMLDVVKFLMYFFEVFIFMILGWIFFVEILYIKEVEIDYLDVFFIMVM